MDLPHVDNLEEFRCISLCTGYAGIELGLRRVIPNLRTVAYVEVEAFACANLVAKIEKGELDAAPVWTDIKTFPTKAFRDRIHIITAGFPCQPFSVAGKQKGGMDARHLWPYIERIIKAVRPIWVFLENVPGLLSARTLDNRPDLCRYLTNMATLSQIAPTARERWYLSEHIRRLTIYLLRTEGIPAYSSIYFSLRNLGYRIEARLFTAAECGAPHRRERLFILAYNGNGNARERGLCSQRGMRSIEKGRKTKSTGIVGRQSNSRKRSELENSSRAASGNQDRQIERRARQEDVSQGNGTAGSIRIGAASELADTTEQRIQRPEPEGTAQAGRQIDQQGNQWPSRPGQPQYEWEEPRVVGNCSSKRLEGQTGTKLQGIGDRLARTGKGQAQSSVGRAAYGISSRLDESKSGINNEKVFNVQQANSGQEQVEQKVLQQPVLRQVDNAKNTDKRCEQKKGSTSNQADQVPTMRQEVKDTATSRRLQQTIRCSDIVPEMPHERRSKIRALGQSENRINRLRLLGNGVVPQQAELAFRELIKLF